MENSVIHMTGNELIFEFQEAVDNLRGGGAAGRLRHKNALNELMKRVNRGGNMDNRQAIGYMLLACRDAGLTHEQAQAIYKAMYLLFDLKTEEEAEEQGRAWYANHFWSETP